MILFKIVSCTSLILRRALSPNAQRVLGGSYTPPAQRAIPLLRDEARTPPGMRRGLIKLTQTQIKWDKLHTDLLHANYSHQMKKPYTRELIDAIRQEAISLGLIDKGGSFQPFDSTRDIEKTQWDDILPLWTTFNTLYLSHSEKSIRYFDV
jgi:hypothetical protein